MKRILYITYVDFGQLSSGSQIRPQKIYDAFIKNGYTVDLLEGNQSKANRDKRIQNIHNILYKLMKYEYDFCYIESPSDPILLKEDKLLIKKIHTKKIPLAYFYRDAYYKLGKEYFDFSNFDFLTRIKKKFRYYYYKFLFFKDDMFLKRNIDIVYFPSQTMASYFHFKCMKVLPPAGDIVKYTKEFDRKYLIYVGGVSKAYGIDIVLRALNEVNQIQYIPLLLICRENEGKELLKPYLSCQWLNIIHANGEELTEYYKKARIAILPKINSEYSDMSISIKLFEYISYGLPILASNVKEQSIIINQYKIGWIYHNEIESIKQKIIEAYNSDFILLEDNLKKALEKNLWKNRIEQIKNNLNDFERIANEK